jgi:hypothetical protein
MEGVGSPPRRGGRAGHGAGASDLFTARFECSTEELIELYRNPHWRSSAYGGNPWAEITRAVCDLQRALDESDTGEVSRLLRSLPEMRHNTGAVGEKLGWLGPYNRRRVAA